MNIVHCSIHRLKHDGPINNSMVHEMMSSTLGQNDELNLLLCLSFFNYSPFHLLLLVPYDDFSST
jgi:hypothetical protein